MLVAIIIVLVLVTILVVYELWLKERLRKRWLQITISIIFAAILSPAVFHIITTQTNRDREESEQSFQDAVLKALYNQNADYKDLQELIKLKYKDVFLSTEQEADQWVEDFLNKLSQMRVKQETLKDENQMLVAKLELQWGPLYKYLLTSFDKRAEGLASRLENISIESHDAPLVQSDQVNQSQLYLRNITFPNGNQLKVEVHTAVVEYGIVTWYPNLIFSESTKGGQNTVFVVTFRDNQFELIGGHPRHQGFIDEVKSQTDPLGNQQFLAGIKKAMNRAFESGLL